MVRRLTLFALACATLSNVADPNVAQATPPDTFGFGSRSTALGGAVTASVEDVSATYYNPAGLARSGNLRVTAGYLTLNPELAINGERSDVERHGAMTFGMVLPATFGDFRLALGLGFQLPDQRVARTRSAIVDRPRWELYDTRSHRLHLAVHLAIRPVPWLTLGAGLAFQSQSTLTLDIRGDLPIVNPELNARLEHQFRGELESIRYPTIGMQIRPTDRLDIGLVYRGSVSLSNTIIAIANADVTGTTLDFDLVSTSTSLFAPQQVSLALQYQILDSLSLAFELTWMDWSKHPSLIADQQISLTVDILGDLGEIGALPPLPMNLHDTFVPRLGVEYRALEGRTNVDLRFGYVYENSPFPTQRGITNFVDNDKHTLSLGLGLGFGGLQPTLPGRIVVNAHALLAILQDREHIKDSLADSVGDYRSSGFLYGLGVDLSVVFE